MCWNIDHDLKISSEILSIENTVYFIKGAWNLMYETLLLVREYKIIRYKGNNKSFKVRIYVARRMFQTIILQKSKLIL